MNTRSTEENGQASRKIHVLTEFIGVLLKKQKVRQFGRSVESGSHRGAVDLGICKLQVTEPGNEHRNSKVTCASVYCMGVFTPV